MASERTFAAAIHGLRGSENQLFDLLEQAPFGVYVDDPTAGCTYANDALLEQFRVGWDEFRGLGWARFVLEDDVERLRERIRIYETELDPIHVSYRVRGASHEVRWIHARVEPILDADGRHVGSIGITHDTTAERAFEEQAARAQKLQAIGRLSARVAHDFNNLLTPMLFAAETLDAENLSPAGRTSVEMVHQAISQARQLTGQLLTLSRHRVSREQVCELDAEIQELERLLCSTLGEGIALHLSLDADDVAVPLDAGQLGQVLINLCTNAADAMSGHGAIHLRTKRAHSRVTVEVEDFGMGMSEDVRARAIEPFFTTKESGRGTGLGLSTVHDIITLAGGELEIDSTPGRGTRVAVTLPQVQVAPTRAVSALEALDDSGGATALLIDDKDSLRQSLAYALALRGFQVLGARNLEEARARSAAGATVDVIITDVMLPDGRGTEIVSELRTARPNLPVLYISGFVGEADLAEDSCTAFLEKPFGPAQFLHAIAQLLTPPERCPAGS